MYYQVFGEEGRYARYTQRGRDLIQEWENFIMEIPEEELIAFIKDMQDELAFRKRQNRTRR